MKFTPEQVIEMARAADLAEARDDASTLPAGYVESLERLCTLAADRALEAAAQKCDSAPERQRGHGVYAADQAACATAIRAMKEKA